MFESEPLLHKKTKTSALRQMGVEIQIYIPEDSDNFSFQNNGIKKCTCWKKMGFMGKQWVLGENNVVVF